MVEICEFRINDFMEFLDERFKEFKLNEIMRLILNLGAKCVIKK